MMKFNHETVDGHLFGKDGDIEVPLFQVVDTMTVKAAATSQYQIDVYAKEQRKDRLWLCECKYTTAKMGLKQVEKLEQAADALRQSQEEVGRNVPDIQLWLVSTGGFTDAVITYVNGRDDICYSDHEHINGLFQRYGGNYRIPVWPTICKSPF